MVGQLWKVSNRGLGKFKRKCAARNFERLGEELTRSRRDRGHRLRGLSRYNSRSHFIGDRAGNHAGGCRLVLGDIGGNGAGWESSSLFNRLWGSSWSSRCDSLGDSWRRLGRGNGRRRRS